MAGSGIDYLALAQQRLAPKKKPRSLWGQVSGALTGIPKGLGTLAVSAVKFPVTTTYGIARNVASGNLANAGDILTLGALTKGKRQGGWEGAQDLGSMLQGSFYETAMNLRHPERYAQAIVEGRIVDVALNDIGNFAIVGGAVGKALGTGATAAKSGLLASTRAGTRTNIAARAARAAAGSRPLMALERGWQGGLSGTKALSGTPLGGRLASAGRVAQRAGRLGGRLADAPLVIPLKTGKGLIKAGGSVWRGGLRGAARTIGKAAENPAMREAAVIGRPLRGLTRVAPKTFTKSGRLGEPSARRAGFEGRMAKSRLGKAAGDADIVDIVKGRRDLTPEEASLQAAGIHIQTGLGRIVASEARRAGLDPGLIAEKMYRKVVDEHALDPAAARFAADPSSLTPEQLAQMESARAFAEQTSRQLTQLASEGYGRMTGPLDDLSIANDPVPTPRGVLAHFDPDVQARIQKKLGTTRFSEDALRQAAKDVGVSSTEYANVVHKASFDPMAYTAVYRPIMRSLTRADEALGGGVLRTRPWEFTEGGDIPVNYLPTVVEPQVRSGVTRRADVGATITTGESPVRAEQLRSGRGHTPSTIRALARAADTALSESQRNAIWQAWREAGDTPELTIVDRDIWDAIEAKAGDIASRKVGGGATPGEAVNTFDRAFMEAKGGLIREEMARRGLVAVPESGDLLREGVKDVDITEATPFLSKKLVDQIAPYLRPITENSGPIRRALEKSNSLAKQFWLVPNLRWQVGDAVSSSLAMMMDGISLREQRRYLSMARRMLDTPEGRRNLAFVENEIGITRGESMHFHGDIAKPGSKITKPLRVTRDTMFSVNEWINRQARATATLANLERRIGPLDGIDLGSVTRESNPKVYEAMVSAVDEVNLMLGDMVNMPPWQREFARVAMPFWPWMRHVAKAAVRLPIDDPVRVVFALRIGELGLSDEDLPAWRQGSIKGPFGFWPTNFINPLADVPNLPGVPTEGNFARAALNPLSPALKWTAAGVLGQSWDKGGNPLTAPFQAFGGGGAGPRPLLFHPNELAYNVLKTFPAFRQGLGAIPGRGEFLGIGYGDAVVSDTGRPYRTRRGALVPKNDTGQDRVFSSLPIILPAPVSAQKVEAEMERERRKQRARPRRRT